MKKLYRLTPFVIILFTLLLVPPLVMAEDAGKININTASLEELTVLNRVGPKYAQRIIDYRENIAPFAQPQDIMKVEGIGLKTYEANIDMITVN
jgi:competence protein ComEA